MGISAKSAKRKTAPRKVSAGAAVLDAVPLGDRVDQLSTRLILEGTASLAPADFEEFAEAATEGGQDAAAAAARTLAQKLATAADAPIAELTGLLSWGLEDLRRLLDGIPAQAVDHVSADEPQPEKAAAAASDARNTLAADEGLIREFITESTEHLSAIESYLLVLEKDRGATGTINSIFGGFHTIKGLAGFLEFSEIQALAHEVETLLDLARTGQLEVTPAVIDVVLESTDLAQRMIAAIADALDGKSSDMVKADPALLQRIRAVAGGEPEAADAVADAPPTVDEATDSPEVCVTPIPPAESSPKGSAVATAEPERSARRQDAPPEKRGADSSSVRIDTVKLDQLMDMVGEMVIAQTLIGHSPALANVTDPSLQRSLSQLARITEDVQRITTGMRMVPIGIQFQKSARLVRDLSRRAGKQVVFEATGEDTELDKTIAEQLADPLLHMVRNSIDHGIEPPAERIAAGKDATARLRVSAYHRSGQIVVSISDDGRGLNRERIVAKAIANGLIENESQYPGDEVFQLIFEPGFSTAEKITDISGRGVGMDVVRRNVQKLRGRIEVQSTPGQGTTFLITLPLTLAIIEGLVVVVGSHRYIAPLFSVREMLRPTADMLSTLQGRGEMVLVRDRLMPVVRLHQRFGVEPRSFDLTEGTLIVAESDGRPFCLFVDDLVGKQEVVIKSLGEKFQHVSGLAGCAILGDGRVGLILDLDGISKGRA